MDKISGLNGDKKMENNDENQTNKTNTVPFHKLFSFADSTDILLMIVGTIGAVGNGICPPLMTVLFGELVNAFGENQTKDVVDVVSKVSLKFVYLALGAGVAAFLQVACWMITGERQAARIRSLYLKTILRQDIAFFDKETNTGEVVGRMSGDTILIQDAMGEKVGKCIQLISTFIGGFIIAFIKGWLLTLVMLSSIPLLVASGGAIAVIISNMASRTQDAYEKAANVVEQTIGAIRTGPYYHCSSIKPGRYGSSSIKRNQQHGRTKNNLRTSISRISHTPPSSASIFESEPNPKGLHSFAYTQRAIGYRSFHRNNPTQ